MKITKGKRAKINRYMQLNMIRFSDSPNRLVKEFGPGTLFYIANPKYTQVSCCMVLSIRKVKNVNRYKIVYLAEGCKKSKIVVGISKLLELLSIKEILER